MLGDLGHRLLGDVALLVLDGPECRDDGGLLGWISLGQVPDVLDRRLSEWHQRSTSPRMKSMLPMMAITSATRTPLTSCRSGCRLHNEGGRTFIRYGLVVPSDTRKKPSTARGSSTEA